LFEEGGSGFFIPAFGEHEINGITEFINGSLRINPFTLDFDSGFNHSPGSRNGSFTLFNGQR